MKRAFTLLASGLLLLIGSSVWAGEEGGVPGTLNLTPVPAGKPPSCCAASSCCPAPACARHCEDHTGRFLDWLCYKPAKASCACQCHISNCWPPLYTYFLDMCQGGGCGHSACGHGACSHGTCGNTAPCAGGGCGHPVREDVSPH
jgi:hypothetical protein